MNQIERFKKGRKIKARLSKDKSVEGEWEVGTFLRLKGEDFFRRVNSDGTLTKVNTQDVMRTRNSSIKKEGGRKGKDSNTTSNNVINFLRGAEKVTNPISIVRDWIYDKTGLTAKANQLILRNTEGIGDWQDGVSVISGIFRNNYYDGKLHDKSKYPGTDGTKPMGYANKWNEDRNIINLYTMQNDQGFSPSKIGLGSYAKNPNFNYLPAYEGNYYGIDTLYLPVSSKQYFDSNIDNRFQQNHDALVAGMKSIEGLDDVQHYGMTPKRIDNKYYVDFEDVWDTDGYGINSKNYPFILNQRIPVIFTNDQEKLNITPELSNWFNIPSSWQK